MSVVKTPADLINAVPFLIGFHPTDSLVVVSVQDDALAMAMRIDFPNEGAPAGALALLASHLKRNESQGAVLVAYVNDENTNAEDILNELSSEITALDIAVRESMIIKNERWRSILCQDEKCCPPEGSPLPDFESGKITAEQVANGKVLPFASDEGLIDSIKPYEIATDPTFHDLVKSLIDENRIGEHELRHEFRKGGIEILLTLKDIYKAGAEVSNELKAQVIATMADIQARDFALGCFENDEVELAKSMYLDLFKTAPKEFSHPFASLASAYAYENGEGALAHRLLDKAIEACPEYTLSKLLRRVMSSGWPPAGFSQLRRELHPRVTASIFGA